MPEAHTTTMAPESIAPDSGIRTDRPSGDDKVVDSGVEIPLSMRADPYTIEFFELQGMDDSIGYKDEISTIEGYILKHIADNSLDNSTASYRAVMKELMGNIGLDENEISASKLAKISTYIKLLDRNIGINEQINEMVRRKEEADERVNQIRSML